MGLDKNKFHHCWRHSLYELWMINDHGCGAIIGVNEQQGNRRTRRKLAPVLLYPPHDLTPCRVRTAVMASRRLTA
jgi:hypothetical protein